MLKSQAPPGVLSGRALVGLRLYQYKAGGTTWLDDAHNPVWEALVRRLPMWLAPNLITLIGTLCIVTAYLLNITYNPGFTGEAPWWVYLVTCVSVALYVNLDCMDGKQARRTGSSSPLGQLFDHGCDALALHMMLANIAASLGVGCGWKMAAGCLGIMVPWMMAQWEEYHTGIMMYGNAFYGVLEANYSICAVHLVSAASGLQLWRTEVPLPRPLALLLGALSSSSLATLGPNLLGLATGAAQDGLLQAASGLEQLKVASGHQAAAGAPAGALYVREGAEEVPLVQTATVAEIALVVVSLAGILQGVSNVQRVFSAGPLPEKEAGHKPLGRGWAFLHLLGLLFVTLTGATSVALAGQPHNDTLLTDHTPLIQSLPLWLQGMFTQLLQSPSAECRMAFSMFGLTYALTASQLIVAHMAKEPWTPSVIALLCPLLYVVSRVVGGGAGWPQPVLALAGLHLLAAVVYFRYVVAVTRQVCAYLGIKCLSITPAKQTAAGKSN